MGALDSEFAALKEAHRESSKETSITLEIPGYKGLLWCRYRLLTLDEISRMTTRVQKLPKAEQLGAASASTLASSCEEFLYQHNPGSERQPLGSEEPVKYDKKLAEIIGFEPKETARGIAMELFKGNGVAMIMHANEINQWIETAGLEAHEAW